MQSVVTGALAIMITASVTVTADIHKYSEVHVVLSSKSTVQGYAVMASFSNEQYCLSLLFSIEDTQDLLSKVKKMGPWPFICTVKVCSNYMISFI